MRSAISKKPQLMIDLLIKEIKLFKNKIEIHFNYSDKTRPDDDSRRVFIFYKKEDVIYIDKHLFCCDAEPFKYNLEFYIWILGKKDRKEPISLGSTRLVITLYAVSEL